MNIAEAITKMKDGSAVTRAGWKKVAPYPAFLFLEKEKIISTRDFTFKKFFKEGLFLTRTPIIMKRESDGTIAAYTPNQRDIFADDWTEFEVPPLPEGLHNKKALDFGHLFNKTEVEKLDD